MDKNSVLKNKGGFGSLQMYKKKWVFVLVIYIRERKFNFKLWKRVRGKIHSKKISSDPKFVRKNIVVRQNLKPKTIFWILIFLNLIVLSFERKKYLIGGGGQ